MLKTFPQREHDCLWSHTSTLDLSFKNQFQPQDRNLHTAGLKDNISTFSPWNQETLTHCWITLWQKQQKAWRKHQAWWERWSEIHSYDESSQAFTPGFTHQRSTWSTGKKKRKKKNDCVFFSILTIYNSKHYSQGLSYYWKDRTTK